MFSVDVLAGGRPRRRLRTRLALVAALAVAAAPVLSAQGFDRQTVERAHRMLAQVRADLLEYYYDTTFGGLDLEANYARADTSLDRAGSVQELLGVIAQFLFDLKDSHTWFNPPGRAATVEYGWRWTTIGDSCFVEWVKEGSDAARKGLAVGQRVLAVDGMSPTRQSLRLIDYVYYALSPRPGMHVTIRDLDGAVREVDVLAKVTPQPRIVDFTSFASISVLIEESEQRRLVRRHFTRSFGDTVLVWRFGNFAFNDSRVDEIMGRARAHQALVIDLRGNSGGAVATLRQLLGHFFDRETRVATLKRRNRTEPFRLRPSGKAPFTGNLIILLDANSASAAEITARVLQLEGKATVVGDRSAGAVMVSRQFPHEVGSYERVLPYGVSVTVEDIVMADEARLEHVGVTPEFLVLPSGRDLAERRDPAMAKALALAGVRIDPTDAFTLFERR